MEAPPKHTLYLVGTPIGNMEDITFRAVRVLKEVSLVAAEDTRRAKILFARHGIQTPLTSYHEQGQSSKANVIVRKLAEGDVALISEAGMPSISDPGFGLVRAALAAGLTVEAIPGPSAVTTAVAVSGLAADRFLFLGFLPRTGSQRRKALAPFGSQPYTLVILESPHRIKECLRDLQSALGQRRIAVCRELTKVHEEVFRGTVAEALSHFQEPRGEYTLVVEGALIEAETASDEELAARLMELEAGGLSSRDSVAQVAKETGLPRRQVYGVSLGLRQAEP